MADNVIHISEQARERYHDCLRAIEEGRTWALGLDFVEGLAADADLGEAEERVRVREGIVTEMERSFHANVTRLFFAPMASAGMLTIHTDIEPLSFFWRYESGYHGGLNFRVGTLDGAVLPWPLGAWSVNT